MNLFIFWLFFWFGDFSKYLEDPVKLSDWAKVTGFMSQEGGNPRDSLWFLDLLWEKHRAHCSFRDQPCWARDHVACTSKRGCIWSLWIASSILRLWVQVRRGQQSLLQLPHSSPLCSWQLWACCQGPEEEREQQQWPSRDDPAVASGMDEDK